MDNCYLAITLQFSSSVSLLLIVPVQHYFQDREQIMLFLRTKKVKIDVKKREISDQKRQRGKQGQNEGDLTSLRYV